MRLCCVANIIQRKDGAIHKIAHLESLLGEGGAVNGFAEFNQNIIARVEHAVSWLGIGKNHCMIKFLGNLLGPQVKRCLLV